LRYRFENLCLDTDLRELRRGVDLVALEPQVFDLLEYLIRNRDRVVSKDDLIASVWGGRIVSESALSTRINAARSAVGDSGAEQRLIKTLPRRGVRFLGFVREEEKATASAEKVTTPSAEPPVPPIREPAAAERRQVTFLSCELMVGPPADAARMDPEDLRDIVGAYRRRAAELAARCHGRTGRSIGKTLLIYFGYPVIHEDDAEQAVRVGLDLRTAVEHLEVGRSIELRAKIGIATGQIIVDVEDEGDARERAFVGEAPNTASQLQISAQPSTVLVDAQTRKLIGGLFDCREIAPINLLAGGKELLAWQVLGASAVDSRFEALRPVALAPLIGRDEELELLLRRWGRAKSGEGRVVLISGEPGIGKSRLIAEFQARLQTEPSDRLRYFCSPNLRDSALRPVATHIERAAGFDRSDGPKGKLLKLKSLFEATSTTDEDVALLADLLSIPVADGDPPLNLSPLLKRQRIFQVLLQQLKGLARRRPLLVVFEDAHWIDPTSLELLDLTVEQIVDLPVLLLVTFRPEFHPPWIGQTHVTSLTLNRLSAREGIALIDGIVGQKSLSTALIDEITERTDGVPLFIEELTKAVLESDNDPEIASRMPPQSPAVPATLHASLMARLERLGFASKEIAQVGAAIGRDFSYGLLAAVTMLDDERLQGTLEQLTGSGLAVQRGIPPDAVYTFKHALVQDAIYGTLLRKQRQELHTRIAVAIESRFPQIVEIQPERVARHFSDCGLWSKSVGLWLTAADRSARNYAVDETVQLLRAGLDDTEQLPPGDSQDRLRLGYTLRMAQARYLQGHFKDSADIVMREKDTLSRVADPAIVGPYRFWLAHMHSRLGDPAESDRNAVLSEEAARRAGDNVTLGKAIGVMALNAYWTGRPVEGAKLSQRAVAVLESTPEQYWVAMSHFYAAMNLIQAGDIAAALQSGDAVCALGERTLDRRVIAYGQFVKGWAHAASGDSEVALRECEHSLKIAPDRVSQAYASAFLGYAHLENGDKAPSIDLLEQAVRNFQNFEFPPFEGLFSAMLAEAYRMFDNNLNDARTAAQRSVELTRSADYRFALGWAFRALARIEFSEGNHEEARKRLEQARNIFTEIGAKLELERTAGG
jgi:DNA-binding winged helix-turn-helix (wHTH) protein/tetratricopeptide (TPR) repeat protein